MTARVQIVAAPFLALPHPALGPALLAGALKARGIDCQVQYLNLAYADQEGPDFVQSMAERTPPQALLGEWIFSHLIHGVGLARPLEDGADWVREKAPADLADQIIAARGRAEAFVHEMADRLLADTPAIVGFSTSFQQTCASLAIAARIKALAPEVLVCFGGANTEGPMGEALLESFPQIDMVFSGESDHTFPDFVADYLADPGGVPAERLRLGGPVTDLDALPHPDFADYFDQMAASTFADRLRPALVLEGSRGCWWGAKHHCTFCSLNGNGLGFRSKTPARLVEEIAALNDAWGVTRFAVSDNIMDMAHIDGVFGAYRDALKDFRFFYEIKANLTPDQMATLAKAGVSRVQPGIESLDDATLKHMDKGVEALRNVMLLRVAAELGVSVSWNILAGFPGERPDQLNATAALLPRLQHLERPVGIGKVRIDRFSPYHQDPERYGFHEPRPAPAYAVVYRLPAERLSRLANFFEAVRRDGLVLADYARPIADAVVRWHERSRGQDGPARLAFGRLGPLVTIEDTRDGAREAIHMAGADDLAVLQAFDKPARVAAVLERLAGDWSHERTPQQVFDDLDERGFVVRHGDKAVHVVTDPSRRVLPPAGIDDVPGGMLLPPGAAKAAE